MNRTDFQTLADLRLAEAKILLDNGQWDGAYYLAGYAVECALKACIAKLTKEFDFPPEKELHAKCYSHDIEKLLFAAGLLDQWNITGKAPSVFNRYCTTVLEWDESSRYNRYTEAEGRELYEAISEPTNGVLPWIKCYW